MVLWVGSASAIQDPPFADDEDTTAPSGALDFKDFNGFGASVTACPQAGLRGTKPKPLGGVSDNVSQLSEQGGNTRANQDYSWLHLVAALRRDPDGRAAE